MTNKDTLYILALFVVLTVGLMCGDKVGYRRGYSKGVYTMMKYVDADVKTIEVDAKELGLKPPINTPGVYQQMPAEAKHKRPTITGICLEGYHLDRIGACVPNYKTHTK